MRKKIFMFNYFLLIIFQILLSNCYGQTNEVKYVYSDGNANTYRIYENKIEYIPVELSESSTGTYDGGDSTLKQISTFEYDSLNSIIQEIISDKSMHINERVKPSGLIRVYDNEDVHVYIISPESRTLFDLENKLKEIIK